MPRGRKRKQGRRTASGRPSRAGQSSYDKGTQRARAMQAIYGTDGADAIGRAYRAGLLGDGQDAKAMLDTARSLSNAYWQAYENGKFTSPLADRTFGSVAQIDHAKVRKREEWLRECLQFVDSLGADVRRAFDQLVIDVNPDCGPAWLDRMCFVERRNKGRKAHERIPQDISDSMTLRHALDALENLIRG